LAEREIQTVKDPLVPNRKQLEFAIHCHDPEVDHIGFGGSIRAGKTQSAGRIITTWAWRYPGTYLVARKTYRRLADSTQKAMIRGDGGLSPCIPAGLIADRRVVDNEVILKSGGTIIFRSFEHPDEAIDLVKNITLGGFFIDQVEELDGDKYEELFDTLEGRLSDPNCPRKGITVANPGPEDHWYHRRVVDPETRDEGSRYVHVTLHDNVENLPEKYVKQMLATEKTKPEWFDRYILGKWGAFGGKRFKCWREHEHVIDPFPVPSEWEIVEAHDYGWGHPWASVWCAIDFEGNWYAVACHKEKERPVSYHAKVIKETRERLNISPSSVWLDPSAWAPRGEYESPQMQLCDYGIWAAKAQNDRLGGWNKIEEMLTEKGPDPFDGNPDRNARRQVPRLRFFRGYAAPLIKELPSLRLKDGTDDVLKANDDASDALRYALMSRQPAPRQEEPDRYDEYARRLKDRAERRRTADVVT
jgi:PBSX family phage terminase large subunit